MTDKNEAKKETLASKPAGVPAAVPAPQSEAARMWEETNTIEYGGQTPILSIAVGEVAGPFTYISGKLITTQPGMAPVLSIVAADRENESFRMPLSATFRMACDEAGLRAHDVFLIRRTEDVLKKAGAGANKPMACYAVKVLSRA